MTIKVLGAELEGGAQRVARSAHAEGFGTQATGVSSHAEGDTATASGTSSHAEGSSTTAGGPYSHSEGYQCASQGNCGHAEGQGSFASGPYTHAEGINAGATAIASHAEGSNTSSGGGYSHAGGLYAKADALGSWARSAVQPSTVSASRAQVAIYNMALVTANTTAATLTFDGQALNAVNPGGNVLIVPLYSNYLFNFTLTARRPVNTGWSQGWVFNGLIARDSGSARMVGTATQAVTWNDGSAAGTVAITANTTSNYLQIQVTAANTGATHWHGVLMVNEFSSTS